MWKTKIFKTWQELEKWIEKNKHKYIYETVVVHNGYGVEYKPKKVIKFN